MLITALFPADIDECIEGSHICDFNAECTNTIGSHNCTCTIGFSGNGSSCGKHCFYYFGVTKCTSVKFANVEGWMCIEVETRKHPYTRTEMLKDIGMEMPKR